MAADSAARKLKKCQACKGEYEPRNTLQKVCSTFCALSLVQRAKEKQERKELLERKRKLKTRAEWLKEAQIEFNAYCRARDKDLPCISCGVFMNDTGLMTGSRIDAGHYRSTGSCPELRFEPLNCHSQCVRCNRDLSGNSVNYRIGLLMRLGEEVVAFLEGPHEPKKYTIDDLKAIKAEYQRKRKELTTKPFYPV